MNLLSLYSGVGGIDLAAHWAGMRSVAFCESDAWCRKVLARHWPDVPIFESDEHVTRESIHERIDIIAGGPPCQPFSVAGKRGGVADPRHRWPQMARIVSELRPAWVCVENVAGFGEVAERLVRPDLEGIGYETIRVDIPAAAVGAPHERNRIFVVAYANRLPADESLSLSKRGVASLTVACRRVADTDSAGLGKRRRAEPVRPQLDPAERSSDAVGNATSGRIRRWQEQGAARLAALPDEGNEQREALTGLGRDASRISDRLDSARWPASRGQEQHEWEPPRVTTERENRRRRLKALGNAVAPMQIYPILAAIYEWERTA